MRRAYIISMLAGLLCMPVNSVAQVQAGSFVFGGTMRTYLVFLPQHYDGVRTMPIVFNLHGYTLDAQQQLNYSRMNDVADTAGFIVVYPNALNNRWEVSDVGFINALIDTLSRQFSINKDMVYCCGFSLGGVASFELACQLSNRIAAVASVAGPISQAAASGPKANHRMPVLLVHGTADELISYNGTTQLCSVEQTLEYWVGFNLCTESDTTSWPDLNPLDGCTVERIRHVCVSDSVSVVFCKVKDGGHTWPGGEKQYLVLNLGNIGKTNEDMNASREIWDFFKHYRLSEFVAEVSNPQCPIEVSLYQNYPNPFNPSTTIKYELPKASEVRLSVYDMLGREVSVLVNERRDAGVHDVIFEGSNLASGVYFYRMQAGDPLTGSGQSYVQSRKLCLVR